MAISCDECKYSFVVRHLGVGDAIDSIASQDEVDIHTWHCPKCFSETAALSNTVVLKNNRYQSEPTANKSRSRRAVVWLSAAAAVVVAVCFAWTHQARLADELTTVRSSLQRETLLRKEAVAALGHGREERKKSVSELAKVRSNLQQEIRLRKTADVLADNAIATNRDLKNKLAKSEQVREQLSIAAASSRNGRDLISPSGSFRFRWEEPIQQKTSSVRSEHCFVASHSAIGASISNMPVRVHRNQRFSNSQ